MYRFSMDTTLFLESTVHFYSYTHFMPVHMRKKHVNEEAIRRTISRKDVLFLERVSCIFS